MKSIYSIVCFLLFTFQFVYSQQYNDINFIYAGTIDSVVVTTFKNYDKETSSITDKIQKDQTILLSKKKLSAIEIVCLNKHLKSSESYISKVPLLDDYNVEFKYYLNNKIIQNIKISSLTKKLKIKKEDCLNKIDKNKNLTNPCLYYASVSKRFEKIVMKLIK